MSRSNPWKPKPRSARATAQIVVEGFTEEAFCKHLKSLYGRNCGVRVDIHNARDGSPQEVVRSALVRKGFDRTIVLFDSDRPLPANWAARARRANLVLLIPSPCMEAFLLTLLDHPVPGETPDCKRALEPLLPGRRKFDSRAYAPLFPRALLDSRPHSILDTLKKAFQPVSEA